MFFKYGFLGAYWLVGNKQLLHSVSVQTKQCRWRRATHHPPEAWPWMKPVQHHTSLAHNLNQVLAGWQPTQTNPWSHELAFHKSPLTQTWEKKKRSEWKSFGRSEHSRFNVTLKWSTRCTSLRHGVTFLYLTNYILFNYDLRVKTSPNMSEGCRAPPSATSVNHKPPHKRSFL